MASPASTHAIDDSADQLALIVETQQVIATATGTFDELMAIVADRAVRLTGAAASVIEVPQGDDMVYVATAGTAAGYEGLKLGREGSISGLCVQEEATLVCVDSETDPRVDRDACRRVGARSMLVVPLREATPEGAAVIKVYSPQPDAFLERDAQVLELMAELIASAMRRTADLAAEREQVERLQELDRLKDEIVGVVTHELRSPITSITGYLQLALEQPDRLDPETLSFLRAVERNAARLGALVDDLLTLLRAESGHFELDLHVVDLARVAWDAVHAVAPLAERNAIELDVRIDEPTLASADEARMAQVFDNLLSNAIKYSPEGGRVELLLHTLDGSAELVVADHGIGIPEDEQQFLFQRFFRSSSATDRSIPGTGLGLAIVKTIVETHGGTIDCQSASGRGTAFRVSLPSS